MIFAAARSGQGLRVCMCCGEWLGLLDGVEPGAVSHGMCEPACEQARAMYGDFCDLQTISTDGDNLKTSWASVIPQQRQSAVFAEAFSDSPCPSDVGAMLGRPSDVFVSERHFVGAMQEVPS